MKLGISCAHPDDLGTAESILTQFGEATGCVVVADGHGTAIVGDVIADCASIRSVEEAVKAVNAQVKDGHTFTVFKPA